MTDPWNGLALAAMGVLIFFCPGLLYLRGRNWFRPLSKTEQLIGKIFGGCIILVGLALALK